MHAGNLYSSERLYRTWLCLRNSEDRGATTDEIGRCTGSRCPGTDISALRQSLRIHESHWEIPRAEYVRTTKKGAKVYRYRMVWRA